MAATKRQRRAYNPGQSSGIINYTLGQAFRAQGYTSFALRQKQSLALWECDDPRPVVVSVRNEQRSFVGGFAPRPGRFNAGVDDGSSTYQVDHGFEGRLAIRYGVGAAQQYRYIDVVGGSYQLPPCTVAEVVFEQWDASAAVIGIDGQVAASLAPGVLQSPTEMTQSLYMTGGAAGVGSMSVEWAQGARYWTMGQVGAPNPALPVTLASGSPGLEAAVVQSTVQARWPSYPRFEVASTPDVNFYSISGDAGLSFDGAFLRLFLEA